MSDQSSQKVPSQGRPKQISIEITGAEGGLVSTEWIKNTLVPTLNEAVLDSEEAKGVAATGPAARLLMDDSRLTITAAEFRALLADPSLRVAREARVAGAAGKQAAAVQPQDDGRIFLVAQGVAVIRIWGPLFNDDILLMHCGWSGYKAIRRQVAAAMADPEIRAILLQIDSPGGMSSGLFDLTDFILAQRGQGKPIVAVADPMALSAAYAIAASADAVGVPLLGELGSIGVWTLHLDFSRLLDSEGIEPTFVFAGARKIDGNPFQPLSDPARAAFQRSVDHAHDAFVAQVSTARGLAEAAVRATEAAVFEDQDAVDIGLADEVTSLDAVLEALQADPAV